MKPSKYIIILIASGILLCLGCEKRFAYLNKVKAPMKKGTITFKLINQSPQFLNSDFENEVQSYCLKRLHKEGYTISEKNPLYELDLYMKIDSSLYKDSGIDEIVKTTWEYSYSVINKSINLNMEVRYIKTRSLVWEDKYDLFFFNDYGRDLFRTKGVIKYMLSGINDTD